MASAFAVNSITIHGNIFGKIAQLTLLVHPIYNFLSCRRHSKHITELTFLRPFCVPPGPLISMVLPQLINILDYIICFEGLSIIGTEFSRVNSFPWPVSLYQTFSGHKQKNDCGFCFLNYKNMCFILPTKLPL